MGRALRIPQVATMVIYEIRSTDDSKWNERCRGVKSHWQLKGDEIKVQVWLSDG